MSAPQKTARLTVTCASDGTVTAYLPAGAVTGQQKGITGRLIAIGYVKNNYADTVDFTITAEETGQTLWTESNVTASKICYPSVLIHSNVGVESTTIYDYIRLVNDRIKIVLASGGNGTTGDFYAIWE